MSFSFAKSLARLDGSGVSQPVKNNGNRNKIKSISFEGIKGPAESPYLEL
jgi:hypothetical protein